MQSPLERKDIEIISAFTFRVIQNSVRIDKIMKEILSKQTITPKDPSIEPLDLDKLKFQDKVSLIYRLMEVELNEEGWKNIEVGSASLVFTAKKLKTVLMELARIRNLFAHEFLLVDVDESMGLDGFNPGVVEFFLSPEKGGNAGVFPSSMIPLKINPRFLERKNNIEIAMGEHFAIKFNTDKKVPKNLDEFESYQDMFMYFELLESYAIDCLNYLNSIYKRKEG